MSKRPSLPGAAELFRVTGGAPEPANEVPPLPGRVSRDSAAQLAAVPAPATDLEQGRRYAARRRTNAGQRRSSPRQRHDEKITVYCSAEELVDLESARLALRADYGLVVDRGRMVREAVAVLLADLEAKGENSILVRRLRET